MTITAFKEYFENPNHDVLLVTHRDPDIDAIGSCLAMHFQLERLGIPNHIWTADDLFDHQLTFLPGKGIVSQKLPTDRQFDTVMVLDCSNLQRVKDHHRLEDIVEGATVINIDHHSDNTLFGDINIYEPISSVGELLYQTFTALDWPVSQEMAACMYSAIVFDTGRFLHSNTTQDTLARAAELIGLGADSFGISQAMFENKSEATFELMRVALDNLVVKPEKGYAYTVIPYGAPNGEVKVVDFIRQLGTVDVFLVFRERRRGEIRVNLRSKAEFNVQEFAGKFGGGGHPKASGIRFEGAMEPHKKQVLAALESALNQ